MLWIRALDTEYCSYDLAVTVFIPVLQQPQQLPPAPFPQQHTAAEPPKEQHRGPANRGPSEEEEIVTRQEAPRPAGYAAAAAGKSVV
jgi:hypothetical protein